MNSNDHDADVSAAIKKHAARFDAPSSLRADITQQIGGEHATKSESAGLWWHALLALWRHPALSFAAGALVAGVGVALLLGVPGDNPLVAELVADHARSMVTAQTIEIASANSHTVKPWLSGKLGYSPAVIDLAELGYPLVGGRRGFIGRTVVGVLVYQRDQHEIDVYALPAREFGDLPQHLSGESGYHMAVWRVGDIAYVAVSDASGERLRDFGEALRQRQTVQIPAD
jgi:anti-sigma factor RsiW